LQRLDFWASATLLGTAVALGADSISCQTVPCGMASVYLWTWRSQLVYWWVRSCSTINPMITPSTPIFVFDVESIGLHGQHFAVAGGVFIEGRPVREFLYACPRAIAVGQPLDRKWINENIPDFGVNFDSPEEVGCFFSFFLDDMKREYPTLQIAAECAYPVETRFLAYCLDSVSGLPFTIYPLHEIASFMAAAGMDPMATYDRLPNELPKHDPRADARQSARLLHEALVKLSKNTP
jgi:hypothetical protein